MNKKLIVAVLCALAFLQVARADVPWLLNYQGRLVTNGSWATGTFNMSIKIFSNSTDVAAQSSYSETIGLVDAVDGFYSFQFGTNTPAFLSALASKQAWLEVSVGGTPLVPRTRLLSVPYALMSAGVTFPSGLQITTIGSDLVFITPDGHTNLIRSAPYVPNRAPTATNDVAVTATNTPVVIAVLNNDTDPDGDTLTVTGCNTPTNQAGQARGTTELVNTTAVRYTPSITFTGGVVAFAYTIADGRGGSATGRVVVTVSPSVVPDNMVLIPAAGKHFIIGDSDPVGTYMNQAPEHRVNFTYDYYIDKYEVSWVLWRTVYNWAITHGYTFEGYAAQGKGDDYPVYRVGWVDCIKWCNARSEMEGLTPVYYSSSSHTVGNVIRSGQGQNIPPENCLKDADGYRLPTEAEWEYAARGGDAQTYYPWGNTLVNGYATHSSAPSWVKVDANLPGNFGLHNMGGNVFEWCYEFIYKYTSAAQTDPWQPGPDFSGGDEHVTKGGAFNAASIRMACAHRWPRPDSWVRLKTTTNLQHGFRTVRTTLDDGRP